ncbi:hypothetical protein I4U23_004658 [Adineta vaga]|nr:hypothetical protein I4U23_004658 [Adineta vaga]
MEDVALIDDLNDDLLYPIPSLLSDSSTRMADDRICEPPVTVQSSIQNNVMPFSRQRLHDNVLTVSDHLRTWASTTRLDDILS